MRPVEVSKGPGDDITVLELFGIGERLEQTSPDDLEALFRTCRTPRRLHSADDVAKSVERLAATLAADLNVVGLRVRRCPTIGRGQADHQQAILRELRRLGQDLGKAEMRLEPAGREVALVVELPGIGHPLIDQDEARAVLDE